MGHQNREAMAHVGVHVELTVRQRSEGTVLHTKDEFKHYFLVASHGNLVVQHLGPAVIDSDAFNRNSDAPQ